MALLERGDVEGDVPNASHLAGALMRVAPETISGAEVRPEWPSLTAAPTLLLHGLSAADMAGDRYARFRSFLFEAGFVPLRRGIARHPGDHPVYTRSALLLDPSLAGSDGADSVSMVRLGQLGRFGNQLWQYLFLRMYGLRNGLAIEVPAWEGEGVFGFSDRRPDRTERPSMAFLGAGDDDLELWEIDDAPRNVDFKGYFQCVPPQWREHRAFIRRLYTVKPEWRGAVDRLHQVLTREGRTLVTIHVRRGDYLVYQDKNPYFRIIPTDWYCALLDELWPGLERPVLHVATDEPNTVNAAFGRYEQLDAAFFARDFGVPDYLRDFVLLQEADALVACNSSFSTMAAVTGKPGQQCWLVDFRVGGFTPYDPWSEPSVGARFLPEPRSLSFDGYGLRAARRRGVMMRYLVARHPELTRDMDRLINGLPSLQGGKGGPVSRYVHRLWRAIRGR